MRLRDRGPLLCPGAALSYGVLHRRRGHGLSKCFPSITRLSRNRFGSMNFLHKEVICRSGPGTRQDSAPRGSGDRLRPYLRGPREKILPLT
jgi:hypothetical protein